ncbi:prolyl oligopeptidase family serine peptidase [Paenibacillus sp. LMG 31456]|uniref:Prolyl oligopeptidase family serine peptidase n=1 Tax=Paenibacillus foliorum TaxID=2654974 RepID=A0A972GJS0_9BACL|nr:dienelactone hydrolase family protein [Paenibacillus foliorum]NOU92007.1 prolyl oligopeptidase family serine peptidase [Paenibacillus foliorum]
MGLQNEWVKFGENEQYSGYLVLPEGPTAAEKPAVIVIQEIWGVDSHIQDVTGRFAKAGYVAFAPDLFHMDGAKMPELQEDRVATAKRFLDTIPPAAWRDPEARGKALSELPDSQGQAVGETLERIFAAGTQAPAYLDLLAASASYLRGRAGGSRPCAVGAVGFCLGGMLAAQLAVRDRELGAAVVFYGNLPQAEQVPQVQCPMLGIFGELDTRITEQVPAFAAAMEQHGKPFEHRIYEGAPHAFANDTRASYRPEAAQDAFARTLTFLRQHLV